MKSTSFLIKTNANRKNVSNLYCVYSDSFCSLYIRVYNTNHIQFICDEEGFIVYVGEKTKVSLSSETIGSPGQGTLVKYNKTSKKITIDTDRLGTALLYYSRDHNDNLEISNRLDNLTLTGKAPNWPSIQQYLNTGYTIGSSTFFQKIEQTLPNENLTACSEDSFQIKRTAPEPAGLNVTYTIDQLVDEIASRLSIVLQELPSSVLMMSAGWDSRTLLMTGPENYHTAYTHGDLSSREISIARTLTGNFRMDHTFSDIRNLDLSEDLLQRMLDELGFCIFPVWYIAGQRAHEIHNAPLSSGVLGELLGGHYGVLSMGTRFQKILASASLVNDNLVRNGQFKKALERFTTPPTHHWFLSAEGHNRFAESANTTKDVMRNRLDATYQKAGDWQSAIETFNMEHRARQYILKQAQAASCTSGYIAPFADDELAKISQLIPFGNRVHNKLNQRVLRARNPELLNYSMAATLLPAKYPILLQEFSRAARITLEQARKLMKLTQPRLGWFNYQHLYQSNVLNEVIDSLNSPILDKSRMRNIIEENPKNGIDAGSTLDMMCKIKTIDYYLKLN
ncbi:hypothetical protein [Marinobacter maritimus]|uniref:hypothetical protein n=1 Tax=Marinobacter maritimus TaxID=277961 RepID=UPI00119D0641|nr:hypothetical protein [Marinobacter maritimus]